MLTRSIQDCDGYPALGLYFRFFDVAVSVFLFCVSTVRIHRQRVDRDVTSVYHIVRWPSEEEAGLEQLEFVSSTSQILESPNLNYRNEDQLGATRACATDTYSQTSWLECWTRFLDAGTHS